MKKLPLFEASATLIGTVIGAGILGIPYVVSKVGFGLGVLIMLGMAVIVLVRQLMFAELTLRTPHTHQIPGYAGIYLGRWMKRVAFISVLLSGYGTLLAYLIGEGEVLAALLGGSSEMWGVIFLAVAAVFVYIGLNIIKRSELVMTVGIFLITLAIGFYAWDNVTFSYLSTSHPQQWILAYGVFLFAFSGSVAIPEMREELKGRERYFPRVVVISSIIVFVVYVLFTFLVLGVTGPATTEVATVGLGDAVGKHMIVIGNLLAFFTIGTSFLTSGLAMKEMFVFDYQSNKLVAWVLTMMVPLVLYFAGARDFISVLGIVGGVLAGLQSIILIVAFWRSRIQGKRKPEFELGPMYMMGSIVLLVFLVGVIMTLVNTV